jgi:excisionase family DNA binding protein
MTSDMDRTILSMEKTDRTARTLLTVAEVSDELRVTHGTTYKWIRDGTLPAVRVGGTVRVPSKLLIDRLARSIRT